MSVDLHMHSTASDGAFAPAEVMRRAAAAGIETLALSDHDTTAGLAEAAACAAERGMRLIPAIELTVRVRAGDRGTIHLLGYGIEPGHEALEAVARRNREGKARQIRATLERLREQERVDISWDELAEGRPEGEAYVGRHHIAAVLVRRGLSRNRRKAFRRYLRNERVPEVEVVSAEEGLNAIVAAGGQPVFAHPTKVDLKHHLNPLLKLGLKGIEAYRARLNPTHGERILERAEKHGLWVTGGSDWHGHYPDPPLGTWKAPSEVEAFVEQLGY